MTSEYPWEPNWQYSQAKINRLCVLLEPNETPGETDTDCSLKGAIVAIGLFDIAEKCTSSFWCIRLITQEGLMLRKDGEGYCHRLGVFPVKDEA